MRATLEDARLARYAGQFVWLELNFDKSENQTFFARHEVLGTPTFFIVDPANDDAVATQVGAMSLAEVQDFLSRGSLRVSTKPGTEADAALKRGDQLLSRNLSAAAADAYRDALQASTSPPQHELALASLVWALDLNQQWQPCAETASAQAPGLPRSAMFGRTVFAGMECVNQGEPADWAEAAAKSLVPLAKEAIDLPATVRDHRYELYRHLMLLSLAHDNKKEAAEWGDRWLRDIDAEHPANDEERSALDIARVEDIQIIGDPMRILPALLASERAMPSSDNASLRVAQMESAAKRYKDAIAACDRGLARTHGPMTRTWLIEVKADALLHQGRNNAAIAVLRDALPVAQTIPVPRMRDRMTKMISGMIEEAQKTQK